VIVDSIQALLIDEDEDNLTAVPERLRYPFAQLGWLVVWTTAKDPGQVRELFSVPGAAYDLIVVDLPSAARDGAPLNGSGGSRNGAAHNGERGGTGTATAASGTAQSGLNLICEARERFPGAFILAISGGDAQRPDLLDEARRSGAHRVLWRYEFSVDAPENSPMAIATEIHNHLLDTGATAPIAVTYDELDPNIQVLVHAIGEPTLCRLYARILEAAGRTTRNMSLGYIAPGYSGAAVCAVTAALDNSAVRTHHVLKVSLDKDALTREAQRGAEAAALLRPALLARQSPPYPVGPVNGWYALASQLQGSALTLRDWLARGASEAAVEDVFAALFTDGLGGMYADTAQEIDSPADLLRTPYYRQRRVLHAVKELSPVLTHPDGCRLPESLVGELTARLTAFVTEGRIGTADRQRTASQPTYGVFSHGDLHATNVLVYEGRHPEPTVIDASRFGHAHWATDPARLAVDLLMHSVDPGAASMFFTGFERWREVAARLGRLEPLLDPSREIALAGELPGPGEFVPADLLPKDPEGVSVPESRTSAETAAELAEIAELAGIDRTDTISTSGPAPTTDELSAAHDEVTHADAPSGDGTLATLAALNWLTGNLRAFCPGMSGDGEYQRHAWEWHTALARYLLRCSYNHEITVPKRALAIVAAHDQLTAAAASLPE
jgi:hypothetical protein